jgi:excisionase family DNA binding protein
MQQINGNTYYTLKEVANKFNVTTVTVLNWIKNNKIKCNRISERKIYISEQQIEDYIKGN